MYFTKSIVMVVLILTTVFGYNHRTFAQEVNTDGAMEMQMSNH